jgi:hypothetical protein
VLLRVQGRRRRPPPLRLQVSPREDCLDCRRRVSRADELNMHVYSVIVRAACSSDLSCSMASELRSERSAWNGERRKKREALAGLAER